MTESTNEDILRKYPHINGREIYECANQLQGYVDPSTPEHLARFLLREADAACDLADEIVRLTEQLAVADKHAEKIEALLEPHISWADDPLK